MDLLAKWNNYIDKGLMKNIFEGPNSKIEAGIRSQSREQYIVELTTKKNLCDSPRFEHMPNGMDYLFNPFGALKPSAATTQTGRQKDLPEGEDKCVFACQDSTSSLSLTSRPPLARITFSNSDWLAFPNVTPWEPRGLLLWVQAPANTSDNLPHRPQMLTPKTLADFLEISFYNKNFATFFNAVHGGASANHLHFQSAFCNYEMAVEKASREQMGNYTITQNFPATALIFPVNTTTTALWSTIDKIQQAKLPFNLIALPSGLYLFIRNIDHEIPDELPGRGLGAINLAGLFITSDKTDFTRVTEKILFSAFSKTTLDPHTLDFLKHTVTA